MCLCWPDTALSRQPDNMPESPCHGLLPPSRPPPPLWKECSSWRYTFQMQTNRSRVHTLNSLIRLSHSGHYTLTRITPEPSTKSLGTAPMPQSSLNLFLLTNPKSAYPASPIPSQENHNKDSCPVPPWLFLTVPSAYPCCHHGMACPLSLGTVSDKLFFNGSCVLICLPSYTWYVLLTHYIFRTVLNIWKEAPLCAF